jgi:hypothetical protein
MVAPRSYQQGEINMVRIHINRHVIAANAKHGRTDPPISVVRKGRTTRHATVEIIGNSRIVYSPHKPLHCGAKLWIECDDVRCDEAAAVTDDAICALAEV